MYIGTYASISNACAAMLVGLVVRISYGKAIIVRQALLDCGS